jgi:hypothetical protein
MGSDVAELAQLMKNIGGFSGNDPVIFGAGSWPERRSTFPREIIL